jgi:hypothetical protein
MFCLLEIQARKTPLTGLGWYFVVLVCICKGFFIDGKQCFVVLSAAA